MEQISSLSTQVNASIHAQRERLNIMLSALDLYYDRNDFAILLLGPAPPKENIHRDTLQDLIWKKRDELRRVLVNDRFFVIYGEDLNDIGRDDVEKELNPLIKEQLVAEKANLILVLAASIGVAAELAYFCQYPSLCKKMVIAIHEKHEDVFLSVGPLRLANENGATILKFTDHDLETCNLKTILYKKALKVFESRLISMKLISIR